ncbi:fatty acid oxidation complex subunit alpha FadB [Motiliproteus coralliicola]|uniref:enoyl-CoA hydratase n=1 Tax=Motiliproteus coralliicola TaxID=2283196 RepID=A0A369WGL8_9GAMM|nr:fatty acid oxidation complex subunit alpha FadB [Motiliproteus coralliicola]RDE19756.1 fatty acid oxidation complex subunit alpha FadB [Motiliproteus coralliicola]
MIYQGQAIQVIALEDNIFELRFDREGSSINKFDEQALTEFKAAIEALQGQSNIAGVLVSSAKDAFIVGADITMFHGVFARSEEEIVEMNLGLNQIFNALEDLPCPTVTAINGLALGGGFELCLSTDYRVMADSAKVGLPEVKLGIFPGWGGSVRLPRLIGVDNAIEWICSGNEKRADKALFEGAADVVVSVDQVRAAALDLLAQCQAGKVDYLARRAEKTSPVKLTPMDAMMAFETAKGFVAGKAGPHYPAPVAAIKAMQKHAAMGRDKALEVEAKAFAKVAKTDVCANLVGLFLSDQQIKKVSASHVEGAAKVGQAAVLGAGIMGGGIAYQSAVKGTPILMKDINEQAIQTGLDEASRLLSGQVERGRMDSKKMAASLSRIRPTLSYGDFAEVDLVVEAVVENPKVKGMVLAEVEKQVDKDTILTSNTSTISISRLAESLQRPENFCGMHFFNPVHRMPLVEVIRGEKTSDAAIAATVAYAQKMGKTPIVVNDCPGFLVNRILFPYFGGFAKLLEAGVELARIDKVMERFGWPMGPAYLLDVVGLDTAVHANGVMAEGFPDRMASDNPSAIAKLVEQGRLGQKSGSGFYNYEKDRKGKLRKQPAPEIQALLDSVVTEKRDFSDEEIIAAMMVPLCMETVRCLEDNIVASAAEADMGLIYGIGFPPFRGGALRYIDAMGVAEFCQLADSFAGLGNLYKPTDKLRAMAADNQRFYS